MKGRRPLSLAVGVLCFLLVGAPNTALSQRAGDNVPGEFDFYVLALSWSPSFCKAERAPANRLQCDSDRPYAFIVHGLWPQYERGWPEFCPGSPSQPPGTVVRDMLDLMPSEGLVRHQWAKHGTCSGLSPQGYFKKTREAREQVRVPERFVRQSRSADVSPSDVEQAFRAANAGLTSDAVAVTCNSGLLREVRICLERQSLDFRPCPNVTQRACSATAARMPPAQ